MKQYRAAVIFITAAPTALLGLSCASAETGNKPASAAKLGEVDFPIAGGA
jgi:hypothetical protein